MEVCYPCLVERAGLLAQSTGCIADHSGRSRSGPESGERTLQFFEGGRRLAIQTGSTRLSFRLLEAKGGVRGKQRAGLLVPSQRATRFHSGKGRTGWNGALPLPLVVLISYRWDADVRKAALFDPASARWRVRLPGRRRARRIPVGTQPGKGPGMTFRSVFAVGATLAAVVASLLLATRRQREALPLLLRPPRPPRSWSRTTTPLTPTTCRASRATRTQHRFRRRGVFGGDRRSAGLSTGPGRSRTVPIVIAFFILLCLFTMGFAGFSATNGRATRGSPRFREPTFLLLREDEPAVREHVELALRALFNRCSVSCAFNSAARLAARTS